MDPELVEWIQGEQKWLDCKDKNVELAFVEKYLEQWNIPKNKMWSSKFGEKLVELLLSQKYPEVIHLNTLSPEQKRLYRNPLCSKLPDLETRDFFVEVKTRNYTTQGTAGDKVLAEPIFQRNYYEFLGKPLIIVLVGYMEYEVRVKNKTRFGIFDEQDTRFADFIASFHISFKGCSELLQPL